MPPTKILSLDNVFTERVAIFFSDRSLDFALKEDQTNLTVPQRNYLTEQLGFPIPQVINIRQVHGDHVISVGGEDLRGRNALPEADGIITNAVGVPIAVRTADCLPVFIFDPQKNCVGLVHAGWRGTHREIAMRTLQMMRKNFGTWFADLKVAFGPSIRSCCYEVGPEFKKYFPKEVVRKADRFYLDLPLINKRQLLKLGIKEKNICDCKICTCCERNFFSYRREKEKAGRMVSLMMLKSK